MILGRRGKHGIVVCQPQVEMSGVSPKLECPVHALAFWRHGWSGAGRQACFELPQRPPLGGQGNAGVRPERPAVRCTAEDRAVTIAAWSFALASAGIGVRDKLNTSPPGAASASGSSSFRYARYRPLKRTF